MYHKQTTLLAKIEKNLAIIEAEKAAIVAQEAVKREVVIVLKQSSKLKFSEFFKSFKSEKFTINFNSTSTILNLESIIKLNVALVASLIFISISENSNSTFLRSISLCSTSYIVTTLYFSYDKRLMTFKKCIHTNSTSKALIQAEFRHTFIKLSLNCITCCRCDLILEDWKFHDNFIKEHFRKSFECSETNIAEEKEIVEAAKSKIIVKNINFFDFTMQINLWKKFHISINNASFLYHLIEFAVKYKKKNLLKFLFQCFRDSALQWLKNQFIKFTSLSDFTTIITKIFSFSLIFEINFNQTIIDFSPQNYHRCLECAAQFSSTSRFLTHAQKNYSKIFTCKHCEETMTSNNKFHEHVRLHYNKTLKQRFVEKKDNHIDLSITFLITTKISRKAITTSSKVVTKSSRLSKSAFVSITSSITFKSMSTSARLSFLFISMTKALDACFITFSSSSSQISMLKYQESHRKSYFIMNDLFEMFAEKLNKRNMSITQKNRFSCFSESRQSRWIRQTRIKSLRQRDSKNTIMIAKKQFKKNLNAIRKKMRSSLFSMFDQINIINYFKFVNQSFKSFKFNAFINCFCSTFRIYFSVNQDARTSRIAIDETSDLEIQQKIKNCFSSRSFEQEYIVVASVDHIKKNIRVETSLTNARKYNSIKSSIKLFKSLKSFKKLKFNIFSNKFNSTSRICFSVNQVAETSQYQHIAIDKTKLFKSLKINSFKSTSRVCFSINQIARISQYQHITIDKIKLLKSLKINSFSSTLRFSLSINHDSIMSQMLISISSRVDFFDVLINQIIYVSINSRLRRFKQRYIAIVVAFICI